MNIEEIQESERAKWDQIARNEASEASTIPPYPDFVSYARDDPRLAGVSDFLGDLSGLRVLEYGCGLGKESALLAKGGADVSAFDISAGSVEVTRKRAEANGLKVDAAVAAGEDLPYADESFDVVVGVAVLHHLAVDQAWPELMRVLKPGGRAAFVEPMGMNPVLNFARDHLPYRHKTPRGADEPLTYDEVHAWGKGFTEFRYKEVQLLGMIERFFGYDTRFRGLHRADVVLLERLPFLRRYCRYVVMLMVK